MESEKPQFLLFYRFLEGSSTKPFRSLDFENSTYSIFNLTNSPLSQTSLFLWNPFNNIVEFEPTICTGSVFTKEKCFNQLPDQIELLIRLVQENVVEVYLRNESFKYEIIDRDMIVFTRDPDPYEYIESYVTIELSNTTIINLKIINDSVAFYCPELAGQELTAYFYGKWKLNFHDLSNFNETIGVELGNIIKNFE